MLSNFQDEFVFLQIIIIDGEKLKYKPAVAMNELQSALKFERKFDYNQVLKYVFYVFSGQQ